MVKRGRTARRGDYGGVAVVAPNPWVHRRPDFPTAAMVASSAAAAATWREREEERKKWRSF